MTYKEQIKNSIKELTESLTEDGLRGSIVDQKKTWIIFYKREIERLTNGETQYKNNGEQIYKTRRRKNKRPEGKQHTTGHPEGRLEKKHNDNKVFAG